MPPKPKVTREEIIQAAFEITRESGINAVVAREVGRRLNVSVTPVFNVFENMEDLKREVYKRCVQFFDEYMADLINYTPAFKEFGLRLVRFGVEERNVFNYLFLTENVSMDFFDRIRKEHSSIYDFLIQEEIHNFQVTEENAIEIQKQLHVYACGLIAVSYSSPSVITKEFVIRTLSEVCVGLVNNCRLREGTLNVTQATVMANSAVIGILPQRKEEK